MRILRRSAVAALTALWLFHSAYAAEQTQPQKAEQAQQEQAAPDLFPPEQIGQLVAPVALYPDALLAQILMAATYPLDIVQAARWQEKNKQLEGEALQKASDEQPWDPSVKTLVFFPSVLDYMNDNLDWTQDLGDAVLGQQDDVMDAVQRLRREAEAAGTLKSTEQQRVEREGDTIIVQPADPEVVYVPSYTPAAAYGQPEPPPTTYYPATYTTPVYTTPATTTVVESSGTSNLVSFGVGALVGGLLTSAILWDRNDYRGFYYGGRGYYGRPGYWGKPGYWNGGWRRPANINVNRNVNVGNVNINRGQLNKWEHNPVHRGGIRYRNEQTRQKFAHTNRQNRIDRDIARGRDPNRQKVANLQRPDRGQVKRPGAGELKRPQAGDRKRPAGRDLKRPETRQAQRPQAKRPQTGRAKGPSTREIQRPKSREANIRKPKGNANRAAAPKLQRPARSSGGASAFSKQRGGMDRAASRRGAASRGGGRARAARGGGRRG